MEIIGLVAGILINLIILMDIVVIEFINHVAEKEYQKLEKARAEGRESLFLCLKNYLDNNAEWQDDIEGAISMASYKRIKTLSKTNVAFKGEINVALRCVWVVLIALSFLMMFFVDLAFGVGILIFAVLIMVFYFRFKVTNTWSKKITTLLEEIIAEQTK